jgi:hypothetical protein
MIPNPPRSLNTETAAASSCAAADSLSGNGDRDEDTLRDLAARIRNAGLASPAILWLASLQPLVFLGTQAAQMLVPLLSMVADETRIQSYLDLFSRRENVTRFLELLEARA